MSLSRIMSIDYGTVRIGIALSDPLQIIANPFKVIQNSEEEVFSEINSIIKSEKVGKIILGLPVNLEGKDTKKTIEVRDFFEKLKNRISIPIIFWDESYSSAEAEDILRKMGKSIKESRKVVDKFAASIILKSYLDSIQ
jgi:putative Holliday junction resolvase